MTPTEQDKELREQITPLVIEAIENDLFDGYYGDEICDDTWHFMHSIITAYGRRVALEARIDELPFLKGMKETSASLLEDGSGDFVRVQDLDTRLGDWINELEMLTQQRKEK